MNASGGRCPNRQGRSFSRLIMADRSVSSMPCSMVVTSAILPGPLAHTALQYEPFALTRDHDQAHDLGQQQCDDGGRHQSPEQRLRPKAEGHCVWTGTPTT